MYFPYLRGKQYELIALRELSDLMSRNSDKISPIIEPVKNSSTLRKTLEVLKDENVNFNLVINPEYGDLVDKTEDILTIVREIFENESNFQLCIIINSKLNVKNILSTLNKFKIKCKGLSLVHNNKLSEIKTILPIFEKLNTVLYNIINTSRITDRRYYRNITNRKSIVNLDDSFKKQSRNSDYDGVTEFTSEHLYFKEDNYKGFGDFLIIGDHYSDTGFMPYAIAIHISFKDQDDTIKIKHFISDSNGDTSDVAGKFYEANYKLVNWCKGMGFNTIAIEIFNELLINGHFPGLGTVKKLAIMNHIELMIGSFDI
jgi:hypothetical protein